MLLKSFESNNYQLQHLTEKFECGECRHKALCHGSTMSLWENIIIENESYTSELPSGSNNYLLKQLEFCDYSADVSNNGI